MNAQAAPFVQLLPEQFATLTRLALLTGVPADVVAQVLVEFAAAVLVAASFGPAQGHVDAVFNTVNAHPALGPLMVELRKLWNAGATMQMQRNGPSIDPLKN